MTRAHPAQPTAAIATAASLAPIRLPLARLAAWLLVGAAVVSTAAGALVAGAPGLNAGPLAGGAVAAGTLVGLLFLGLFGARPPVTWAMLIIAGSSLRMGSGLAAAMWMYLTQRPDKAAFWTAFLAASLVLLALEVIVLRPALLAGTPPESPRT